ncbi:uncharacterized protein PAC_16011 [Phialocephala subalpina]|uniref:Uncharacterized protein n=1 Tax=Phialocephala subalpina TaxID=576137 RepID=A0A1L7XM29_9HELO|nr:uncharacterized protein PAC_16011 [Phialocephala subalpina]
MDHYNNPYATCSNDSSNTWTNMEDLQAQEVPQATEPVNYENFDYSECLYDDDNEFVDPQNTEQNKDFVDSDYEKIIHTNFAPKVEFKYEYSGEQDISVIPAYKEPAANNEGPVLTSADAPVPQMNIESAQEANLYNYPAYPQSANGPVFTAASPTLNPNPFNLPEYALPANNLLPPPALPTIVTTEATLPSPVVYRNFILNSFTDASTPLKVIDVHIFPFEQELENALYQELVRQQKAALFTGNLLAAANDQAQRLQDDEDMEQELGNYFTSQQITGATTASASTPANGQEGKQHGNKRPINIKNFDASKYYTPLAFKPASWGTANPDTEDLLFEYTQFGELNSLSTFTTEQLIEFISKHPLNPPAPISCKTSGLRLWIQTVPADSDKRYPNKVSSRCRFTKCSDPQRTIRKGDFRVCFDEQASVPGNSHDPFHNAGYVHLFCLEKFLDFPQLCKDYNVQPDTRVLLEGKNKMAITRDHPSMEGIVRTFIEESKPWEKFGEKGVRPEDYYAHTLNYALTSEHLKKQPKHLQAIRAKRGGVSIDVHMNDLEEFVELTMQRKEAKAALKKGKGKAPAKAVVKREKRKRSEVKEGEDEESVIDDDILDLQRGLPSRPRRMSKRLRRSL